jgi:type 1 glutamine amidotransferase
MEKIKTLLISGLVTSEHDYPKMNQSIRTMLEATGRFTVKITEEFNGATKRTVEDYDLIILNYDGKTCPTDQYHRWNEEAEDVFFDFIQKGKGLVIHHSCVWQDENLPDRFKKAWGIYLTSPQSRKNPCDDVMVQITAPENPIMKGLSDYMVVGDDFFAGVEIYPDTNAQILASVYDDINMYHKAGWPPKHHPVTIPDGKLENMRGVNTLQPVAWTNTYGQGRVFACSLGHDMDTYRRINYLTMFVRGAEWAATGEVTLDKPDRSGENRFKQWPYY